MTKKRGMLSRFSVYENSLVYLTGVLLLYLALALLVPIGAAIVLDEDPYVFVIPLFASLLVAIPLISFFSPTESIRPVDGIFLVSGAWIIAMFVGAVPYALSGMGYLDACFESMSGFTTTGATIMTDIESWPASLLLWRSFTQWLGGAGIIMVFVTILPMLGIGGRNLFKNEFTGLDVHNFSFRIREAAKEFHLIYLLLSGCLVILILIMGESLYDSLTIMFSTMSTGGFSPHSDSIAHFGPGIQWIVILFMFLGATNFYLHYRAIYQKDLRAYKESTEFRTLALVVVILISFTFLALSSHLDGFDALDEGGETFRHSAFHIVSAITSSGFSVDDYTVWPVSIQMIILVIMFIGASSGSTAGGLKMSRFVLAFKYLYYGMLKQIHPRAVISMRMDGKTVSEDAVTITIAMVLLYACTLIAATFILLATGVPLTESFSAVSACISNHGPGMGAVGPYGDYGWLNPIAKSTLIFAMWAGRLELITVFILLTPAFWREFQRHSHQSKRVKR